MATLHSPASAPGAGPLNYTAYRACMQQQGVNVSANGSPIGTLPSNFSQAVTMCGPLAPVVTNGGSTVPTALLTQMLQYAQCMRSKGLDVPDPQVQNGLASITIPQAVHDSPAYGPAQEVCSRQLPSTPMPAP